VLVADLCVPPLALLTLLAVAMLVVALAFKAWIAALLAASALASVGAAVLIAWARFGRETISLVGLACAGIYAASKIPLYARFVTRRRQADWVRTDRS
jgi:hypothetical protein